MAYMINQQYTTAILEGYRGRSDVAAQRAFAERTRRWIESLEIDPEIRAALVEPIRAVEEAFVRLESTAR